jgi:HTH-type transcriptional regulator / antitoxin HigA
VKPKVIKNQKEHKATLARIDQLMDACLGTPQGDELELLAALVEIYEDEVFPIDEPHPLEAIRFRMEQQGLKASDLVSYMGSRSKVSEVLSGHRGLSLKMIRSLSSGLGIPTDVLVRESRTPCKATTTKRKQSHKRAAVRT